ncbi:MAG: hypothetical protein HYU70_15730 [Bacteroidetes bacterium]|nr:hypothetical protein [Bacteroidota bacterium]
MIRFCTGACPVLLPAHHFLHRNIPVIFGNRKPDSREAFLFIEMTPDNSKMY